MIKAKKTTTSWWRLWWAENLEDYQSADQWQRPRVWPNLDDEKLSIHGFPLSWSYEFTLSELSVSLCSSFYVRQHSFTCVEHKVHRRVKCDTMESTLTWSFLMRRGRKRVAQSRNRPPSTVMTPIWPHLSNIWRFCRMSLPLCDLHPAVFSYPPVQIIINTRLLQNVTYMHCVCSRELVICIYVSVC